MFFYFSQVHTPLICKDQERLRSGHCWYCNQKYCTDNKETIKDALLELRINKYIKYDSETKKLIAAPIPYTEWDEDLR